MKLSFCPFCAYTGGNYLSYLNHIIIAHYNANYGCGKCLKQAFVSSSALHNHKKVCIRLIPKKSTGGSGGKPSSGGGCDGSCGGFFQGYPKEGWQGLCHRLPGLQPPSCFPDITTPQWMRDIPPPQVPQGIKGLR